MTEPNFCEVGNKAPYWCCFKPNECTEWYKLRKAYRAANEPTDSAGHGMYTLVPLTVGAVLRAFSSAQYAHGFAAGRKSALSNLMLSESMACDNRMRRKRNQADRFRSWLEKRCREAEVKE